MTPHPTHLFERHGDEQVCLGCGTVPSYPIAESPCGYRNATNGTRDYKRCREHARPYGKGRPGKPRPLTTRQLRGASYVLRNGVTRLDDIAPDLGVTADVLRKMIERMQKETGLGLDCCVLEQPKETA